ncbi:hypothetical protein ACIHFE_07075 [Streptomyces sp. NPDC052396]|uniref:hypothetical protein n=1 Tax=Streptomyces sp. NPDC052396 TaxID=3365689 RepID=UPI0037CCD95C
MRPPGVRPRWGTRLAGLLVVLISLFGGAYGVRSLPYALGWAGTHGTLTVEWKSCSRGSRGGCNWTSEGIFQSDDGKVLDNRAQLDSGYEIGQKVPVSWDRHTYYTANWSAVLGWFTGLCLALFGLSLGAPALVYGMRLNIYDHPRLRRWVTLWMRTSLWSALAFGVGALILDKSLA